MGPSGCGKSTLLRMIAGLEELTDGELRIGDQVVNDVEPAARGVAMVFQTYALYPHMTVEENMSFGLSMARPPKSEIKERVDARGGYSAFNAAPQSPSETTIRWTASAGGDRSGDRSGAEGLPL